MYKKDNDNSFCFFSQFIYIYHFVNLIKLFFLNGGVPITTFTKGVFIFK